MSLTDLRERNITPNWRPLYETILNGELSGNMSISKTIDWNYPIVSDITNQWKRDHSIVSAVELLQLYSANNLPLNENVRQAARFVLRELKKGEMAGIHRLAESIVSPCSEEKEESPSDRISLSEIVTHRRRDARQARQRLHENPGSAVRHLDMARAYMSLGHHDNALREIKDAVSLAPHNRYVTRCAVKGFLHLDDLGSARDSLRRNEAHKEDPWLLSAALSIDLQRATSVQTEIKRVRRILDAESFTPKSLSELASSLATLEARVPTTRTKEVRRLIKKSLLDPIDNTIAQAQWLKHKNSNYDVEIPQIDIPFDYEYSTFKLESEGRVKEALDESYLWILDKPFSRRAVLQCSNLLSVHFKDYQRAVEVLEAGLLANPEASDLLNNAAYLYIKIDKLDKAEEKLQSALRGEISRIETEICIKATRGLLAFRKKNYEKGKILYNEAVNQARKNGKIHYEESAFLNLLNELYEAGLITKEELASSLQDLDIRHPHNRIMWADIALKAGII